MWCLSWHLLEHLSQLNINDLQQKNDSTQWIFRYEHEAVVVFVASVTVVQ